MTNSSGPPPAATDAGAGSGVSPNTRFAEYSSSEETRAGFFAFERRALMARDLGGAFFFSGRARRGMRKFYPSPPLTAGGVEQSVTLW